MASWDSLSGWVLPPIPTALIKPPLPRLSADIKRQVFRHPSAHSGPSKPMSIIFDTGEVTQDYEKLEHVGESIIGQF